MINAKKLHSIMLYYCMFYLCTFYLFDVMIGRIFKYIFFACIIYGFVGVIFKKIISIFRGEKHNNNVFAIGTLVFLTFIFRCLSVANLEQMIRGLYQYPFYLLIILSTSYMIREVNIDKLMMWLTRYGVILSLCALYEQITHHYIVGVEINGYFYESLLVEGSIRGSIRAAVFSGSPLVFGMLMAIITVISCYCFLKKKHISRFIVLATNLLGLILSYSRAPLVFTTISMIFMFLHYDNEKLLRLRRRRITKIIFFFLIAIFLFFILSFFVAEIDFILQRVLTIFDWNSNLSNISRFNIWKETFATIFDGYTFWIGKGPGFTSGSIGFVTESGVLKRLLELGFFPFALYYFFLYKCIRTGIGVAKKNTNMFLIVSRSVILCILLEDIILQITESVSIVFFMSFFISLLYYNQNNESEYLNDVKEF